MYNLSPKIKCIDLKHCCHWEDRMWVHVRTLICNHFQCFYNITLSITYQKETLMFHKKCTPSYELSMKQAIIKLQNYISRFPEVAFSSRIEISAHKSWQTEGSPLQLCHLLTGMLVTGCAPLQWPSRRRDKWWAQSNGVIRLLQTIRLFVYLKTIESIYSF